MRSLILVFIVSALVAGCAGSPQKFGAYTDAAILKTTHQEALEYFDTNTKQAFNPHGYYAGRADIHYFYGYYGEAVNDYTRAIRISGDPVYNLKRGRSYLKLGYHKDAVIDFTTVADTAGRKYPVAYVERAKAYAEQGNYSEALKDLDTAEKAGGESAELLKALAELNYKMSRYEEAKLYVQKAVDKAGDDSELYLLRARVFYKQKDANQAVRDLRKALETDSRNYDAKQMLAWVYATNPLETYRNGKEAVRLAEELYAMDKDVRYTEVLAAAYAETGRIDKAVEILREGVVRTRDLVQKEDFRFDIKNYEKGEMIRMW